MAVVAEFWNDFMGRAADECDNLSKLDQHLDQRFPNAIREPMFIHTVARKLIALVVNDGADKLKYFLNDSLQRASRCDGTCNDR